MRTRRSQPSSNSVPSEDGREELREGHRGVLLHEIVRELVRSLSDTIVDATLGGANHALSLAQKLGARGTFIGFDADGEAIERARTALSGVKPQVQLVHANFRHMEKHLKGLAVASVDAFLFDLGWSAHQLESGRGFSFRSDEPLLMTYDSHPDALALTARTIVNEWGEESIADILFGWGEEKFSRRIARAIVARRKEKPIEIASDLAHIVEKAVPHYRMRGKIHPATKTFQALRIAVNDEMGALSEGLEAAKEFATSGARIATVTFHSIEDRLVKRTFQEWSREGWGTLAVKKPIKPSREEIKENPRARSAKLRIIRKT